MIKYLITATETLAVPGVLLGMLFAYVYGRAGSWGRKVLAGACGAGFIAACIMSYMKNTTRLVKTGTWNLYIFSISIAALLLLILVDAGPVRRRLGKKAAPAITVCAAILAFLQVFYIFPDVVAYPYTIVLGGDSVFSTGFLYRIIGLVIGLLLMVVLAFSAYLVVTRISLSAAGLLLKIAFGIMGIQQATKILQTLISTRVISSKELFQVVKFTYNHQNMFSFGILLTVVFLPIVLWIRSFHVNEPYENPAEHRKIRAKWRSIRRWSAALLVAIVFAVLNITVVKSYANRPVELSPTEECELRGDSLYVTFDQVADGHLHRFAYTTENGIAVRFIIIKKPNSSAYGIGLDACDICGETGYYERKGQVVCNRCDVVMNINTIGFKGGCNPKVISYSLEDGNIVVPISTLLEHEADFK